MNIKYVHTNIITEDWRKLSDFYMNVFECIPVPPERDLKGDWLSKGTGVKDAHIKGIHLRLPGHGVTGPTLEIFEYSEIIPCEKQTANRKGFGHIAFQVENTEEVVKHALESGAKKIGELIKHTVEDVGILSFVYIADPDGNIIEIQNWS